jgi:hypothetical protein
MTNASPTLPMAVEQTYTLWLWLHEWLGDFPVRARHGVGERMETTLLNGLEALAHAAYAPRGSPARVEALTLARGHMTFLRLLFRGARELRLLSVAQHEFAVEQVVSIGRLVSAWLRREQGGP